MKTKKQIFLDRIEDLITDYFFYDRKNDEDLSVKDIEKLIDNGEITKKELLDKFDIELSKIEGLK